MNSQESFILAQRAFGLFDKLMAISDVEGFGRPGICSSVESFNRRQFTTRTYAKYIMPEFEDLCYKLNLKTPNVSYSCEVAAAVVIWIIGAVLMILVSIFAALSSSGGGGGGGGIISSSFKILYNVIKPDPSFDESKAETFLRNECQTCISDFLDNLADKLIWFITFALDFDTSSLNTGSGSWEQLSTNFRTVVASNKYDTIKQYFNDFGTLETKLSSNDVSDVLAILRDESTNYETHPTSVLATFVKGMLQWEFAQYVKNPLTQNGQTALKNQISNHIKRFSEIQQAASTYISACDALFATYFDLFNETDRNKRQEKSMLLKTK